MRFSAVSPSRRRMKRREARASTQPVLAREIMDAGELALVVGDEGMTQSHGLGGDEQVIAANGFARPFETGTELAIDGVGWGLEGQGFQSPENGFQLRRKTW